MKKETVLTNPKVLCDCVSWLFSLAGPRLGSFLVEPQVLLALAGMKGVARIMVGVTQNEQKHGVAKDVKRRVQALNKELCIASSRIRFSTQGKPLCVALHNPDSWYVPVEVQNLDGYTESFLQWMQVTGEKLFDSNVCAQVDLVSQMKRLLSVLVIHLHLIKKIPHKRSVTFSRLSLAAGIPFLATMDRVKWSLANPGFVSESRMTSFSESGRYVPHKDCNPNFLFSPQNADDPFIQKYVSEAGKVLVDFYGSTIHKGLRLNGMFLHAREIQESWLAKV